MDLVEQLVNAVPDCKTCGDGRQHAPVQVCRFDTSGNLVSDDGGALADVIQCQKCGQPLPILRLILVENREQIEMVEKIGVKKIGENRCHIYFSRRLSSNSRTSR